MYRLLLPLLLFTSGLNAQHFTRITSGDPVTTTGDSRSVNWIDINNDGWTDLMITNGPQGGQNNFLYINNGNGTFTAISGDPVVNDNAPSDGATWSDMDNDGDIDAFVVNWYNVNNLLYSNNGAGTFTQINTGSPVTDLGYSETASWGDYDNDGLVDLYVTNSAGNLRNFLYHNDGNGSFTKIVTGTPVTDQFASRSVNWTDLDNDNDPDLFVTNESNQHENIYRNDAGTFTKITSGDLVNNAGNTMSSSWADMDNDGDLDVILCNDGSNNALFRNDGNMSFAKMVNDTVSRTGGHSFSSAWSDIDNDADVDLYITNSFGSALHNNYLFLNDGFGNFTRVNDTSVSVPDWSYGCAFGDYDKDGFEDLAVATCRFNGADRNDLLFRNNGNSNGWISIKLTGSPSNKSAIGAKVKVKAVINGQAVWQMREVSAQSSYCGQNDLRVHFGLGNAIVADSVFIQWPSGNVHSSVSLNINQFYQVTEGQQITGMEESTPPAFHLFPNPASDQLYIKSSEPPDQFVILDLYGRRITTSMNPQKTESISVSNFRPGVYFVEAGSTVKRFIVE